MRRAGDRARRPGPDPRRLPRAPGDRGRIRGEGGPRAGAAARQDQPGRAQRGRRAGRAAVAVHRDPLPLARGRAGHDPGRARGDRPHRVRRCDGVPAPRARRSRACSSIPSRSSPRVGTACSPTGLPSAATTRPSSVQSGWPRSSCTTGRPAAKRTATATASGSPSGSGSASASAPRQRGRAAVVPWLRWSESGSVSVPGGRRQRGGRHEGDGPTLRQDGAGRR